MDEYVKLTKSEFELIPKVVDHHAIPFIEVDGYILISASIMDLPYYFWVIQYFVGKEIITYEPVTEKIE